MPDESEEAQVTEAATERFPDNVAVSADDFRLCGWKEALARTEREGYSAMWHTLSGAAREAITAGRAAQGKVLWLLADACSMRLRPASPNEPLRPFFVMEGKRSALSDDFALETTALFSEIVDRVDDLWLRARIADLVWLLKRPREVRFALIAIDAYRHIPLDTETWLRGGDECHERAVRLAIMLGQGSGNRLKEMEIQIVSALEQAAPDDGFLALWLADLLDQTRLGRSKRKEVACKLGSLASSFDVAGDLHRSRQYFAAAAKWHEYAGDEVNAASMIAGLAEGWVKEAMARTAGASPSHMVAATFLQNAIHAYRRIPSRRRPDNRVDERLATLHRMMLDAGEKSLSEMGVIQSPPIDVTELVNNARKAVAGKPLKEALIAFADIYHGVRYQKLRASAMELLGEHPLQALFPATVLSRDGRVIARQPGISLAGTGSPDDGAAIWANTVKDYGIQLGIVVQGVIWPALETLTLEHRLREVELIAVASQSPVVPPGREHFVGKALFAGFERDFVTSIHLLVPQVEHMVRWHLKSRLIKTTSLDANGIENEVGLSALLEKSEVCEIFGEDLMFELKAVFADPFGPNLRNEVAHGLLEHDQAQSIYSIYAWWWYFRLVFKRFVIEVGKKQQAPATGPKPEDTEKKE